MTKNCQARCSLFGICKQNRSCKEGQSFDPQPNPTRPSVDPEVFGRATQPISVVQRSETQMHTLNIR